MAKRIAKIDINCLKFYKEKNISKIKKSKNLYL